MKTESNVEVAQGDDLLVTIPVYDQDTDAEFIDVGTATEIKYVVTTMRAGGGTLLERSLVDSGVTTTTAEDVLGDGSVPTALADMGVPEGTPVVRIRLDGETTDGLEPGRYFHECQLGGVHDSSITVMQGEFRVLRSST